MHGIRVASSLNFPSYEQLILCATFKCLKQCLPWLSREQPPLQLQHIENFFKYTVIFQPSVLAHVLFCDNSLLSITLHLSTLLSKVVVNSIVSLYKHLIITFLLLSANCLREGLYLFHLHFITWWGFTHMAYFAKLITEEEFQMYFNFK